eukprot:gene42292-51645_t
MASTPAPFTPFTQVSPPSGEYVTPLKIGRGARVHVVEKNSPIQTGSSPDFRKVVLSSVSTVSSSSGHSSRRSGGSSSGYISSAKSSTTPFPNLTSQRLNSDDVQSLAMAMNAMFDDDEDHSAAQENPPTKSEGGMESTEKLIVEENHLDVSMDSNVPATQTEHIQNIVFESSFESESPPKEEVNYQALLEQLDQSRPSLPRTGLDSYIQYKQSSSKTGGNADEVVNLTKELAKLVFEKDVESLTKSLPIHSVAAFPSRTPPPTPPRLAMPSTSTSSRYPHADLLRRDPVPSSPHPSLYSDALLDEELSKPQYKEHLDLLRLVTRTHLPKDEDPHAMLRKFLLLPVEQLQQTVFKQHEELVKMGAFRTLATD